MGHGHGEPFEVPNFKQYQDWQKIPDLVAHQKRLERLGLSDPWIRNQVHFFYPKFSTPTNKFYRAMDLLKPGLKPGLIIAGTLIAIEEAYSLYKKGHTSWAAHH